MAQPDQPRATLPSASKRKPGRPPKFPIEGARISCSLRLRPSVDHDVRVAAERNNRSMAEEIEHRLRNSFAAEGDPWKVAQIAATLLSGSWAHPNAEDHIDSEQALDIALGLVKGARFKLAMESKP